MDSDSDDGFGRQKADDALEVGEDFDSEDEQEDKSDGEMNHAPLSQPRAN